ncbi:MAG TPA: hypothetical protein DCL66_16615 [Gammaproteobacteria bacterium]|nr:hypothetical protein [Gammaproteobacteria bacterium]
MAQEKLKFNYNNGLNNNFTIIYVITLTSKARSKMVSNRLKDIFTPVVIIETRYKQPEEICCENQE